MLLTGGALAADRRSSKVTIGSRARRRYHVSRHMIVEEHSPGLGRRLAVADHVRGARGLRDDNSEHLELTVYTKSVPARILARERWRTRCGFPGERCGSPCAWTTSGFPGPVEAEAPLVPANQGVRLKDGESGEAAGPDPVQPNPEEAHVTAGSEPFVVPRGDHRKLLTKGLDLQMEEGAATAQTHQGKKQRGEGRLHLEDATVREEKKSTGSISTTFPAGTG